MVDLKGGMCTRCVVADWDCLSCQSTQLTEFRTRNIPCSIFQATVFPIPFGILLRVIQYLKLSKIPAHGHKVANCPVKIYTSV